jgi:sRNA-binding regulator protein Hfq
MVFLKRRPHFKKRHHDRFNRSPETNDALQAEQAGSESAYLKSLIDSHAKVTVVLASGERLQGQIRYYDRECFSIGPSNGGPKIFLRKASVSYISEE